MFPNLIFFFVVHREKEEVVREKRKTRIICNFWLFSTATFVVNFFLEIFLCPNNNKRRRKMETHLLSGQEKERKKREKLEERRQLSDNVKRKIN